MRLRPRPALSMPLRMRGIMLIEAMIGLLIFSIAVLGIISLQANLLKETQQSRERIEASYLANEAISLMWTSDRSQLTDYDTGGTVTLATLAASTSTDPEVARLTAWATKASGLLPGGSANILIGPLPVATAPAQATVTLTWNLQGEGITRQFQTVALIGP